MNEYIPRLISKKIIDSSKFFQVIVVTGPRQSGKTCMCRHLFPDFNYVNLENITDRAIAISDPTAYLDSLGDNVIIDEVQNVPQLLSMIQVRVDEDEKKKYVLTGSSNFSLLSSVSQSLAGRAALFCLLPFSFMEMKETIFGESTDNLLYRGGYPGVIIKGVPPFDFYRNYYNTYVERDLRSLVNVKNIVKFDTFIKLLASRAASELNVSALAREVGLSPSTINEWFSLLNTSYISYCVQPYYKNIGKRLTKIPKVYFYDTGLLVYLLGIESPEQISNHPLRGAIFENCAMSELLKQRFNEARDPNINFYREQSGREVDAVVDTAKGLELYEIKASKTFRQDFLKNMAEVKDLLSDVSQMSVIYDGENLPPLALNIRNI